MDKKREELQTLALVLLHKIVHLTVVTENSAFQVKKEMPLPSHDLIEVIEEMTLPFLRKVLIFVACLDNDLVERMQDNSIVSSFSSKTASMSPTSAEISILVSLLKFPVNPASNSMRVDIFGSIY